jgi:fumarate hydratase subunit alpha
MLTPAQGVKGIKAFVLDTVARAGGRPCPPTIVGVGIGGTADQAAELAKEALLRPLDVPNDDEQLRALEADLGDALNRLGVGPMGLGGRTTVLGVRCGMAYCHTASLPVAVNLQCWAARKASARVHADGRVERIP